MPCGNSGKGQTLSPGRRPTCAQHQPLTYSPGDGEARRVRGQHGPGRPFSSATPGRPCGSLYISQGSESKSLNSFASCKGHWDDESCLASSQLGTQRNIFQIVPHLQAQPRSPQPFPSALSSSFPLPAAREGGLAEAAGSHSEAATCPKMAMDTSQVWLKLSS